MSETEIQYLAKKLDEIHAKLSKWETWMVGENDSPGFMTRLDRLEQAQLRRQRLEWVITSSVVGLVVKAVWELVTKTGG